MKKKFRLGITFLFLSLCLIWSCTKVTGKEKKQDRKWSVPYITGDTFRAHFKHLFDETTKTLDPTKIKEGDVVFVKTDYLDQFFKDHHPRITCRYILLTHNSDHPIPGPFSSYLDDDKIIAWFGQNVEDCIHHKLHPVPIGLENRYNRNGNPRVLEQARSAHLGTPKDVLLYMNFSINTCYAERKAVYEQFGKASFCKRAEQQDYVAYLRDLARSKFVLSPRGNGLDCHRTWEALYMGAIPVVRSSAMDAVFAGLPVLIVKDWSEITEEFLEKKYLEMTQQDYSLERLNIGHWVHAIKRGKVQQQAGISKEAALDALKSKTVYSLSAEAIDVIIPCVEKDKSTLDKCIEGIKRNGKNVRRIIVISAKRLTDKAEWFDEKNYPFTKLDIAQAIFEDEKEAERYLASRGCRIGWIYQQLLKLYAFETIPGISSNVLALDADTVFLNPVEFLEPSGEPLFNPGLEYQPPYFEHASRLIPGLKRVFPLESGISHHMLFQKSIMADFFRVIESHHNTSVWKAFCQCINREELPYSCASEYEAYFNFAFMRSNQMHIRRLKCQLFAQSDDFQTFKKKRYHYVSHHKYEE